SLQGAAGVELVYPADLGDLDRTAHLVAESGLVVSAVNLNVKTEQVWRNGSFTNPDEAIRRKAVTYLQPAMDMAVTLGTDLLTVCRLIDGCAASSQVNFVDQGRLVVEGLREAGAHRQAVRVSIEYNAFESRTNIGVLDLATTLHFGDRVDADNHGVTMDVGP